MNPVPEEVLDYIKSQRVGVIAIEMLDGSPHAATVHYAHTEDPLMFCFETNRGYRKSEALLGRKTSRASFVIGFDEDHMKTLQFDGEVRLIEDGSEEALFERIYMKKFPSKNVKSNDPDFLAFLFIPTWWRFTDWMRKGGKVILQST